MSKKTVLCTGGAGYIGSHLCERLLAEGYSVTTLDNYFTGSYNNLIDGCEHIIGSTEKIRSIFQKKSFDFIVHLGEYSRVEQSFADSHLVWKYNKIGTREVLEYVREQGGKLIYAGSSTKFADKTPGYIKASNTELVKLYGEWYNIDYAITYFYNVYGGREISSGEYATLIAKYKQLYREGKPLPVVKPGTQKRNFTYIDDIIDALVLIMEKGSGDEYGIGNKKNYTIQGVADLFETNIVYLQPRKGNRMSAPVVSEKTEALGWNTKIDLEKHIKEYIKNEN